MNLLLTGMAAEAHEKEASFMEDIANADYEDVRNITSKITLGNPLVGGALTAGGMGLLGYKFGPRIAKTLTSGLNRVIPGNVPQDPYKSQAEVQKTRNRMGLALAAMGAAPWMVPAYDAYKEGDLFEKYGSVDGENTPADMIKRATEYIDSSFAKQVIEEDEHIGPSDTAFAKNIFDEAEKRAPKTTRMQNLVNVDQLTRGAVGAGLGYGAASIVGPMLGGVFGMPRGTVNTLKTTGGLAGALKGSGILS